MVSAKDFVDKCFEYFQSQTKVIQAQIIRDDKVATGPQVQYVFQLKQLSANIIDNNLELIYSVQYRRDFLGGSIFGRFRELAQLILITKTDNIRFDGYTLSIVSNGTTKQVLLSGKKPTSRNKWNYAVKTSLGQIIQTIVNQEYSQTLSGCPACSEHHQCPECEQWDALERLVAAVELHMDNP